MALAQGPAVTVQHALGSEGQLGRVHAPPRHTELPAAAPGSRSLSLLNATFPNSLLLPSCALTGARLPWKSRGFCFAFFQETSQFARGEGSAGPGALDGQLQGSLSCEPAPRGNGHESGAGGGGAVQNGSVGIFSPLSIQAYVIPQSPW